MIIFLLFVLAVYLVFQLDRTSALFSIIYAFLIVFIHCIYVAEFHLGNIDYFISDEAVFMQLDNAKALTDIAKKDRILWYQFLNLTQIYDFTGGGFSKLGSFVFLPFLVYLIHRLNSTNYINYLFLLFMPYALYVSQTALRDVLILTVTMLLIYGLANLKRSFVLFFTLVVISALVIFMLRPFVLGLVLISFFIVSYLNSIRGLSARGKFLKLFTILTISLISAAILYMVFKDKIDQYYRTLIFIQENGLKLDSSKTEVQPGLSAQYFLYSIFRYILTPIPTSLLERIFSGATKFGYLDDFIRMLNQTSLYFMYIYIFFNIRLLRPAIKKIQENSYCYLFLVFAVLNSIAYALYYAGGGHSRLKLVFYLACFLIFSTIFHIKMRAK